MHARVFLLLRMGFVLAPVCRESGLLPVALAKRTGLFLMILIATSMPLFRWSIAFTTYFKTAGAACLAGRAVARVTWCAVIGRLASHLAEGTTAYDFHQFVPDPSKPRAYRRNTERCWG